MHHLSASLNDPTAPSDWASYKASFGKAFEALLGSSIFGLALKAFFIRGDFPSGDGGQTLLDNLLRVPADFLAFAGSKEVWELGDNLKAITGSGVYGFFAAYYFILQELLEGEREEEGREKKEGKLN